MAASRMCFWMRAHACLHVFRIEVSKRTHPCRHSSPTATLRPRKPHIGHPGTHSLIQQHVAAFDVAVQNRSQPSSWCVEVAQPSGSVSRYAEAHGGTERACGTISKSLVKAAVGHEGVHQARLLHATVPRQAEAHEWHEVLMAVAAQDKHLSQHLPQALERRLGQHEKGVTVVHRFSCFVFVTVWNKVRT